MQPYLWDRSGPRDSFVARLERALAPRRARIRASIARSHAARWRVGIVLAAAAAIALIALYLLRDRAHGARDERDAPHVAVDDAEPGGSAPLRAPAGDGEIATEVR